MGNANQSAQQRQLLRVFHTGQKQKNSESIATIKNAKNLRNLGFYSGISEVLFFYTVYINIQRGAAALRRLTDWGNPWDTKYTARSWKREKAVRSKISRLFDRSYKSTHQCPFACKRTKTFLKSEIFLQWCDTYRFSIHKKEPCPSWRRTGLFKEMSCGG